MPIIPEQDQEMVRSHFDEHMTGNVEMVMFTEKPSMLIVPGKETCETCEPTRQLLEEVAALSDKITLTVKDIAESSEEATEMGVDRIPAIIFKGATRGSVRFFGIPSGYEFSGFIADLIDVSNGNTDLSEETREFLGSLTQDVNIKVFTTPS